MYLPCPFLIPEKVNGFIHVNDDLNSLKIFFYPLTEIPENHIQILSNFLFTHRIPDIILSQLDKTKSTIIDAQTYDKCMLSSTDNQIKFISNIEGNKENKEIKFNDTFSFMTFLNQISILYTFNNSFDNIFSIKNIPSVKDSFIINEKSSICSSDYMDDLNAHESLLEYLNFSTNSPSVLVPFDTSILIKLLEFPDDEKTLKILSKSSVPPCYAPLLIIILLLDSPLLEDESDSLLENASLNEDEKNKSVPKICSSSNPALKRFNGIIPDPSPLEAAPKKLFIIDKMSVCGSCDICTDYLALKIQWTTITKGQIEHMPNLRISMKLLEKALFKTYPKNHPLIKVIFNAMTSHFLMRDKFESYISEFFSVMSAVAQLFHPLDKIIEFDATVIEHFVFWLFTSLISKTGIAEIVEQHDPSQLLSKAFHNLMVFHPLMYQLIEHSDLSSFKFPATIVYSLYSNVINGPKLWIIWVSALVSDDPMNFFQTLMAMSLMMIYPNVVGSSNVIESVENNLKLFFEKTSGDVLISNTLKLIDVFDRNG